MQWRKTRPRASALGAALTAALVSGCGSGAAQRAAPPPTFPRAVALELARASDGVAAALAVGDSCRALALAKSLRQQTSAAVVTSHVPPRLRRQLQAAADDLASRIECTPPPAPAVEPGPREHGNGHDEGKHKGEKKHGKDDD